MQKYYLICYVLYVIFAPVIYFIFRPKSLFRSHNLEIYTYFVNIFKQIFNKDTIFKKDYETVLKSFIPSYVQKQSLMLIFIKVFFGTLMFSFLLANIHSIYFNIKNFILISHNFTSFIFLKSWIISKSERLYGFMILLLFTVDLCPFVTGYLTEISFLNNKIRTVDTNIMGIIFCLMCYPPFNNITSNFLGWNQNNSVEMPDYAVLNWVFRIIGLCFLTIYAWASVTLGFKASNLTNRGIVTKFPYNIVRHPAYICKNIFWLFTTIQLIILNFTSGNYTFHESLLKSILIIISYLFWMMIYYFRAITEERHLIQDPDYQEYVKKVRWRFIPYII